MPTIESQFTLFRFKIHDGGMILGFNNETGQGKLPFLLLVVDL